MPGPLEAWTEYTPQTGWSELRRLASLRSAGTSLRSPWTSWILPREARRLAEAEVVSRVRARILNWLPSLSRSRRASMAAPPCLPVAPVMRSVFAIMLILVIGIRFRMRLGWWRVFYDLLFA